jgi:signal transduction histidine kinase/CheY-like chemotaxis protein
LFPIPTKIPIKNIYTLFLIIVSFSLNAQELAKPDPKKLTAAGILMDSLLDISYELFTQGAYKESFELNIKTLKIALEEEDLLYTSKAYGYLGYDYLNQGDTIVAIENFKKAHKFAIKLEDPTILANTYGDLASIYSFDSSKDKISKEYTLKAIETYEATKDTLGLQYIYHNYADALKEKGQWDEVKPILDLLNSKKFKAYTTDVYRASIDNMMAQYYYNNGNCIKADSLLLNVISICKKSGLKRELEMAYDYYSRSLAIQEKHDEAFQNRLKYEKIHEANLKEKNAIENNRIAATFQIDQYKKDLAKSEAESQLQEEKMRNKTFFNYGLIALSLVAILGLFFTFNLSKKRKQLNQALKEKNKLYLDEKTKTEKLARAKSDFFSTVSHELRTPLYGVIGLSTILLENNKEASIQEDLKSLQFSADYLLALINDVLQINKIDSKQIENEQLDFNLRDLIERIVTTFEYMRRQNRNVINVHLPHDTPFLLYGNAIRLSQILMNLIGNANKFTENGIIDISLTIRKIDADRISLAFSIKDNGKGIAQNKKEHIFEEFKQGDSHSYNYQGTGLGLPIVKRLLKISGSDIHLESEIGQGSIFSFELDYPIIQKATPQNNVRYQPVPLDTTVLKGKNILIAEDNRINQMVTKKILEKDGVLCTIAENGQEAVDAVKIKHYDLILMDVNMPVMNGLEATKLIKRDHHIPIIALTAVEIAEMRQSILDAGMDDIIIKPYDVSTFKRVIIKNIQNQKARYSV